MSQPNSQKPIEDRGEESLPHLRERAEPVATDSKIPVWVFVLGAVLAASAFIYLGGLLPKDEMGQFLATSEYGIAPPEGGGEDEVVLTAYEQIMKNGKAKYQQVCQACHGGDGAGSSEYPPLAGSEWVSEYTERLGLIILHGLKGPIEVKGQAWDKNMAPQAGAFSNAEDLAAVMSYVRVTFGDPELLKPEYTLVSPEVAANIMAIPYSGQTNAADLKANHHVYTQGALLDPETGEVVP